MSTHRRQKSSLGGGGPKQEQYLARTLLVELLAHQFCFPVQWIDTQDLVLGSKKTERIIELGPSNTLVNMAKRTIELKYPSKDTAQNVSRQLLSFQQNLDKISYEQKFAPPPEKQLSSQSPSEHKPAKGAEPIEVQAPAIVAAAAASNIAAAEIDDVSVNIIEIVSTIIATGLKKPLDAFQMSKSVKALCGGRSTVQNEIIGDLAAEVGEVPDGAEDLPLDALCTSLQPSFTGKLGKKTSSLIDKLISQKSPGTFQNAGIRKYLKSRWGLGSGRQDSVLLWAVTSQPDYRLKNEEEAKIFLDSIVQIYIARTGIKLPDVASSGAAPGTQTAVSAEALEYLESKQKSVFHEQLLLYANFLGHDLQGQESTINALKDRILELEQQLDVWNTEHGEFYASGIKPLFSSPKARTYDSWWNWAMQDLLTIVSKMKLDDLQQKDAEYLELKRNLENRSHSRLVETIRFLASETKDESLKPMFTDLLSSCESWLGRDPALFRNTVSMAPITVIDKAGKVSYREIPRQKDTSKAAKSDRDLRLGRNGADGWNYDESLSTVLRAALVEATTDGFSFVDKVVLITGAGAGSIGAEILRGLLASGAFVIVTSSSYSPKVTRFYQDLYSKWGARGSKLVLVPFNQASTKDVDALIRFIYEKDGLATDLDYVIPFAAISEQGRDLDNIDSKSELAHRLMLTNTLRLLGVIKKEKESRGIFTRPAQVILPMSPNHGAFGSDGLYAESKLGLESLFEKWHSEGWDDFLSITGAIIGWTRGTALMSDNDILSEEMENMGMRTYSQEEMAFNILALMSPKVLPLSVVAPLVADLSGGMGTVPQLKDITVRIRKAINQLSEERRAIAKEASFDTPPLNVEAPMEKQANLIFEFPRLPDYTTEIKPLTKELHGMVDLDRVVVVTGFAEVGPWGNSRIRWDMELNGRLSSESCVELAWVMGLTKAHSGIIDGQPYAGWLDKETGKPITDQGIRDKYESHMLKHAGIRPMEPKKDSPLWDGREALYEIEIQKDHDAFEVSEAAASELKKAHGDKIHISPTESGEYKVVLLKGAKIMLPKLLHSPHTVAGQLPTGWDPRTFGVPEDVVAQIDPATMYPLVCTAEALRSAGILDPYELYQHVHISEVANCVGSGFGGVVSMRKMFKGRYQDKEAPNDILAESFINSGSAWINMLLISAAGANKTPVGACATSVESLDTGYDLIHQGKAKVCLVGGYDDMLKDIADEFANLKATINVEEDEAKGRSPREMSRPATSSRKGFVESEGAGIQIITSATLALQMGLPIYGVIALTRTAMDKTGRSLPAPGRGILGSAIQRQSKYDSPLMSMAYRRRAMQMRTNQADEMQSLQMQYLEDEIADLHTQKVDYNLDEYRAQRVTGIMLDAERDRKDALNQYGNHFWTHDDRIAPIRGALAVWGLTIDDIDVLSFHGTSTRANEKNEASVLQDQLRHLGRKKGNVVPGVFQKSVTGHPKGGAGAWMLNGCLQMMETNMIPGNRNADNIEDALEKFESLVYPNKAIKAKEIKAFSVTSFGFGQKGAQVIGVHPKFLYATIEEDAFRAYAKKLRLREKKASRIFHEGLSNNSVFVAKDKAPYSAAEEMKFLLDPEARLPKTA